LDKNKLPLKYINERELRKKGQVMFENIRKKITFPMKIDKIETKPCITGIVPRIEGDTLFPIIRYITKLDAGDTVLLEQECDNLHENIGQLFPKIKHNTTRIYYQVFTNDSENKKEVITLVFSRTFKM
ncbi:MAG: hypothetical protein K2L23_01390, partial [Odoribacter sp.]|nr:hypothetical protein [Odoribacter sp.]